MEPPRLLPMLAGGNGVPPNPDAYQLEPKLDGSPHSRDVCQKGATGMVESDRVSGSLVR